MNTTQKPSPVCVIGSGICASVIFLAILFAVAFAIAALDFVFGIKIQTPRMPIWIRVLLNIFVLCSTVFFLVDRYRACLTRCSQRRAQRTTHDRAAP